LGALRFSLLLTAAAIAALLAARAEAIPAVPDAPRSARGEVAVFFYTWYGTPAFDGHFTHWGQNGHAAPAEIASAFFPARGVYSSSDRNVLREQLREIVGAGADTLVISWWGPGSAEDTRLSLVAAEARALRLRPAVHVEPYPGRTPAAVAGEITRMRAQGFTDFYVYDSTASAAAAWAEALAPLAGVRVLANTPLAGLAKAGGFDGLYTYDVYVYDGSSFPRLCNQARKLRLLCAPSVGPGYDARRATGDTRVRQRRRGIRYDWMWRKAIQARAPIVTVTSYNEWHEGTQIEPARAVGTPYVSYDGAWGLRGRAAETAYLDRTAYWADEYRTQLARRR
jgi:glycoprotein endo-alpha-1,2-mannosidase